jgi:hypothetical protein
MRSDPWGLPLFDANAALYSSGSDRSPQKPRWFSPYTVDQRHGHSSDNSGSLEIHALLRGEAIFRKDNITVGARH